MPYSFTFDAGRCTGCQACQLACTIENRLEPDRSWREILTFNPRHAPDAPLFHLSLACNHCRHPACMEACPALAYSRDARTGAVLVDEDKCIGCRYCTWACPYDAPRFDLVRGTVSKCTFCHERIAEGLEPACAAYCPTGALGFAWLEEDALTQEVPGFPRTALQPAIRIEPPRASLPPPVEPVAGPAPPAEPAAGPPLPASRIEVRAEWPLLVLTLAAALLVGCFAAAAAGRALIGPLPFVAIGAVAMGLATAHLGRKRRAWRAILNLAHSPLSREIALLSLFLAGGTAVLAWAGGGLGGGLSGGIGGAASLAAHGDQAAGGALAGSALLRAATWTVVLLGVAALVAVDRVYRYAHRPGTDAPHSAGALLTGVLVAGIAAGQPVWAGLAGLVKLTLYVGRKRELARAGLPVRPLASALRVGVGLLLPAALWATAAAAATPELYAAGVSGLGESGLGALAALGPPALGLVAALGLALAVAAGEIIDRAEFYDELETTTPARQLVLDLKAGLGADLLKRQRVS